MIAEIEHTAELTWSKLSGLRSACLILFDDRNILLSFLELLSIR